MWPGPSRPVVSGRGDAPRTARSPGSSPRWPTAALFDERLDAEEERAVAWRLMERLRSRERSVLMLRFGLEGEPLTLEQIGRRLGVTRERVRQLEAQALRTLAQCQTERVPEPRHAASQRGSMANSRPAQGSNPPASRAAAGMASPVRTESVSRPRSESLGRCPGLWYHTFVHGAPIRRGRRDEEPIPRHGSLPRAALG